MLDARQREIAAELAPVIDRCIAGREDLDDDGRIACDDRVVLLSATANDRSVGLENRSRVDFDSDPIGEGFAW